MQTTYEEYKEWTEDGNVEGGTQIVYDKAKEKAEKLMVYEDELVQLFFSFCHFQVFHGYFNPHFAKISFYIKLDKLSGHKSLSPVLITIKHTSPTANHVLFFLYCS